MRHLYNRAREIALIFTPRGLRDKLKQLLHRLGWLPTWWRLKAALSRWASALSPRRIALSLRWLGAQLATLRRRRRESRLTVAVDVGAFWEPLTGIGWYLFRLLEHLAHREDLRLRLYGPNLVDTPDLARPFVDLPTGPALEWVTYRVPEDFSPSYVKAVGWLRRRIPGLIALDRNDLLFAPNYFLPPWFDRARGGLVVTVHDLSVRKVPETMREETRRDLASRLEETLGRAVRILTDTETVRRELIEGEGVAADRVHAVHLGPGPVVGADPGERPPPGTPRDYVLHVGTLEPRKSVETLLSAWEILRDDPTGVPPLVLCGRFGWKAERLRERIEKASAEGWLHHFGYLEDGQVAALYREAGLVVMPSIYEGFGLPLVEAMAMGRPLLVSDIPVLREVGGEAAAYAPPRRPEIWAERLNELFSDPARLRQLAAAGLARSSLFTWQRSAEATVAVWRLAAESKQARIGPEAGLARERE